MHRRALPLNWGEPSIFGADALCNVPSKAKEQSTTMKNILRQPEQTAQQIAERQDQEDDTQPVCFRSYACACGVCARVGAQYAPRLSYSGGITVSKSGLRVGG